MKEKDLLIACKKNDRRAQNALYKKYFPLMSNVAVRYAGNTDHIELINAGFFKVLENLDKYDSQYSLATWIRTILVRTAIDFQRKADRKPDYAELTETQVVSLNYGESKLQEEDLLKMLKDLPEGCEKVFNMYVIDGFNHREIAEILGISEGTSKWHLSEARRRLQEALEEKERIEKKRKVLRNEA